MSGTSLTIPAIGGSRSPETFGSFPQTAILYVKKSPIVPTENRIPEIASDAWRLHEDRSANASLQKWNVYSLHSIDIEDYKPETDTLMLDARNAFSKSPLDDTKSLPGREKFSAKATVFRVKWNEDTHEWDAILVEDVSLNKTISANMVDGELRARLWKKDYPQKSTGNLIERHALIGPVDPNPFSHFAVLAEKMAVKGIGTQNFSKTRLGFTPFIIASPEDSHRRFKTRTTTEEWPGIAPLHGENFPEGISQPRNETHVEEAGYSTSFPGWYHQATGLGFGPSTSMVDRYQYRPQWWYWMRAPTGGSYNTNAFPEILTSPGTTTHFAFRPQAYDEDGNLKFFIPEYEEKMQVESATKVVFERTFVYEGNSFVNRLTIELSDEDTEGINPAPFNPSFDNHLPSWRNGKLAFADATTRKGESVFYFNGPIKFSVSRLPRYSWIEVYSKVSPDQYKGTLEIKYRMEIYNVDDETRTFVDKTASIEIDYDHDLPSEERPDSWSAPVDVPRQSQTIVVMTVLGSKWTGTKIYHWEPQIFVER